MPTEGGTAHRLQCTRSSPPLLATPTPLPSSFCAWPTAGSGALAQLAVGVMQAEPPSAKHRLVALALLESYVRYWKVLAQAQQYLPKVSST